MKRLFALVLLAFLAASPLALAQGLPTATLSGRVRNDTADLPGVTVTAK